MTVASKTLDTVPISRTNTVYSGKYKLETPDLKGMPTGSPKTVALIPVNPKQTK